MNERYARRTTPFVLAAAAAIQVAATQPAATASMSTDCPASSSPGLHLYVINEASASPQTLGAAILEASAIWATAGMRLTWTFPPAPLDLTDNRTVVVMIQHGLKRPPTLSAVPSNSALPLLGQVPFDEDGPGNIIEVSFGAITSMVMAGSYLNRPVAGLPSFLQQFLLGRSLGRIVAHEIGHRLVGHGHMHDGLMRPSLGDRDLLDWNSPRLPRAWTDAGGRALVDPSSRCKPVVRRD